jgi:glutathione S-transferase
MAITLYGFDGSTYVRTVRMLLAEKGAQYWPPPSGRDHCSRPPRAVLKLSPLLFTVDEQGTD